MKTIGINQLKGNYAEHFVTSMLSETCLVRPVSSGTDIGIDLFCETVQGGNPFKHFWVQVKAVRKSHIKDHNDIKTANYSFKTTDLQYWAKQPIPVYAFLVPILSWPPIDPETVFGIRISENIIRNGIPDSESITLSTNEGFDKETRSEDLSEFINHVVPWDSSIILLEKGIIAPIDTENIDNSNTYPSGIGTNYIDCVLRNIYDSAVWIGIEKLDSWSKLSIKHKNDLVLLSDIVYLFHEKNLHEWGVEFLFSYAKTRNDTKLANRYKLQALRLIKNSTDFDEKKRNEMLQKVEKLFSTIINSD